MLDFSRKSVQEGPLTDAELGIGVAAQAGDLSGGPSVAGTSKQPNKRAPPESPAFPDVRRSSRHKQGTDAAAEATVPGFEGPPATAEEAEIGGVIREVPRGALTGMQAMAYGASGVISKAWYAGFALAPTHTG